MSDANPALANGTLPDSSTTTTHSSRAESAASSTSSNPLQADTPATSSRTTDAGVPAHHDAEWQPPKDGPLKTPIPTPSTACKPAPQRTLTPEEETKYATVLAAVSQWTSLPSTTAKGAPSAPIQDHERMWLTRDCLLRYLRATKWKTPDALKRLQATITWRREYGADTFTADYISPENETGKQLVLGYDNEARPCLYLNPAAQNTKMSDRQIHHLCYMLDRTIDMMPPGQESACLLINFKGAATGNVPSSAQARAVLNILQGHSPERLGKALISELPWYVSTFFKLISPFIDPVTREKMKFNEDLKKYIPAQQLWKKYSGDLDFVYEHDTYWPALNEECKRRREAYRARWERAGKRVGEYEAYLRGGEHPSLQQVLDQANGRVDGELADAAAKKLNV
ncbi:CRAL/TRIO domain-containing protein [Teratosphaeria nubilosa]|uniref:CRAL/TRIO domain-containing protein n=1 Tax=Teratosphaeria nubilosa TaxID=161662 RepID=A0A6G1KU38_9PEZI|nr:CRAL/TRIO domain-containing protein [Teratosphaeria nubilosa]